MTAGQPSPVGAWLDLETVLRHLHESGIRVGIQTFDAGILVWISESMAAGPLGTRIQALRRKSDVDRG